MLNAKAPCQCNLIPTGNDGQIAQHNDHRWNNVLPEEAGQSDKEHTKNYMTQYELKMSAGNCHSFTLTE